MTDSKTETERLAEAVLEVAEVVGEIRADIEALGNGDYEA